jgi:hypothetical protein
MTFGACRTDVRQVADVGSRLVFVANMRGEPDERRYFLSAYFSVADRIGQDEALRRFGARRNLDIDLLPAGASLVERVTAYVAQHRSEMRWLDHSENANIAEHVEDYVTYLNGEHYVHAFYDAHPDWKRRVSRPYLVSDELESCIFTPRIPYVDLVRACPALPAPETLQNGWGIHPRRNLTGQQVAMLRTWWDQKRGSTT